MDEPMEWFCELEEADFENTRVMITKHWDKWLTANYGDYMLLPPIEERKIHQTVSKIDFGQYE